MASHGESTKFKLTIKEFKFSKQQGTNNRNNVIIRIPEVLEHGYGMFVWPCAPVLAQYVWYHSDKVKGRRILEVGAGTALPGVLSAKLGGNVTLSDSCTFPQCLENCRRSCLENDVDFVNVVGITWGLIGPDIIQLQPVDVILASDCFYDKKDFEDVLVTAAYLFDKNPAAEMWCTYQERSASRSIQHLLKKWNLSCQHIPLESFDADTANIAGSNLPGAHTIHMLVIKLKTK